MPQTPAPSLVPPPLTLRAFHCRCGQPVFFRNSVCLACQTPLGYDPQRRVLLPLVPAEAAGLWQAADDAAPGATYRRCANLDTAAACNWLLGGESPDGALCLCCGLTRTVPDLSLGSNALWWGRIEVAKRRLVSSLLGLGLPLRNRVQDAQRGLVFDLLQSLPGGPPVVTGHADGVITIDVEEADDVVREHRRSLLHEPYRTLLGHLRHEVGHYYWWLLVKDGAWLEPFRSLFGDEREDYAAALQRHYEHGAAADWCERHVSAYAGSHPWEDWAESWAHYLHMVDTLDTARSFGLDGETVELSYERYSASGLGLPPGEQSEGFVAIVNGWMELTGVLNELSRSMGVPDFYPFVLSATAVQKLHLVHQVVGGASSDGPLSGR